MEAFASELQLYMASTAPVRQLCRRGFRRPSRSLCGRRIFSAAAWRLQHFPSASTGKPRRLK